MTGRNGACSLRCSDDTAGAPGQPRRISGGAVAATQKQHEQQRQSVCDSGGDRSSGCPSCQAGLSRRVAGSNGDDAAAVSCCGSSSFVDDVTQVTTQQQHRRRHSTNDDAAARRRTAAGRDSSGSPLWEVPGLERRMRSGQKRGSGHGFSESPAEPCKVRSKFAFQI